MPKQFCLISLTRQQPSTGFKGSGGNSTDKEWKYDQPIRQSG
jgi:hypothetical protein